MTAIVAILALLVSVAPYIYEKLGTERLSTGVLSLELNHQLGFLEARAVVVLQDIGAKPLTIPTVVLVMKPTSGDSRDTLILRAAAQSPSGGQSFATPPGTLPLLPIGVINLSPGSDWAGQVLFRQSLSPAEIESMSTVRDKATDLLQTEAVQFPLPPSIAQSQIDLGKEAMALAKSNLRRVTFGDYEFYLATYDIDGKLLDVVGYEGHLEQSQSERLFTKSFYSYPYAVTSPTSQWAYGNNTIEVRLRLLRMDSQQLRTAFLGLHLDPTQ